MWLMWLLRSELDDILSNSFAGGVVVVIRLILFDRFSRVVPIGWMCFGDGQKNGSLNLTPYQQDIKTV